MTRLFVFNGGSSLNISEEQEWVLENNGYICYLSNEDCILGLLPVFDIGFESFYDRVNELNISFEVFNKFPMIKLLKYPFDNQRTFWAEQALDWIKKGRFSEDLMDWAFNIHVGWMPQKLMHDFVKTFKVPKYLIKK